MVMAVFDEAKKLHPSSIVPQALAMRCLIKSYTRRDVLKVGAASAFAFNFFPSRVFGANNRIAVAGIGAGGKGTADIAGSAAAGADTLKI